MKLMLSSADHGRTNVTDPRMPFLASALSPAAAQEEISPAVGHLSPDEDIVVARVRLVRHKPGRRCVIEYEFNCSSGRRLSVFGKARAKGLDQRSYELQSRLYERGFHDSSDDFVSVPRPIGKVPRFNMWLQRKVEGVPATGLLERPGSDRLAERIATALFKLHGTPAATSRRHSMNDELRILAERLDMVAKASPSLRARLCRLLSACRNLVADLPLSAECGVHRDFYPDQVLVDGQRLYLVDFDLYCRGQPGIDAGNFVAHLIEQRIRRPVKGQELLAAQWAFVRRYAQLAGSEASATISPLTTLALARHVQLSTLFPDREHTTERLIELCESRLQLAPCYE